MNHDEKLRQLETRGTTRGANAILEDLAASLDRARLVTDSTAPLQPESHTQPRRRRWAVPAAAMAAAFTLVLAAGAAVLLAPFAGSDTTPSATLNPTTTQVDLAAEPDESSSGPPATSMIEPMAVVQVLELPNCVLADVRINEIIQPVLDRIRPSGADAVPSSTVTLADVAKKMPVPRVGELSMLSGDLVNGACSMAVQADGFVAWAILSDQGTVLMAAGSEPLGGTEVPDSVLAFEGEYQQARIATGQTFTGPINEQGEFLAVVAGATYQTRLVAGYVETSLLPHEARLPAWTRSSLAAPAFEPNILGSLQFEFLVPHEAPTGFGLCAAIEMFQQNANSTEREEESSSVVLCNPAGDQIIATQTIPDSADERGAATTINGHTAYLTTSDTGTRIYLDNGGGSADWYGGLLVEADASVSVEDAVDVTESIPLAAAVPTVPIDADVQPAIGVAEGLDYTSLPIDEDATDGDQLIRVTIPEDRTFEFEEEFLAAKDPANWEFLELSELSKSMEAIVTNGFEGLDPQALQYSVMGTATGEWNHESVRLYIEHLNLIVDVGQQRHPVGQRTRSPISPQEFVEGGWLLSYNPTMTSTATELHSLQVVAYAPAIDRSVNMTFQAATGKENRKLRVMPITEHDAHELVMSVLAAVAPDLSPG